VLKNIAAFVVRSTLIAATLGAVVSTTVPAHADDRVHPTRSREPAQREQRARSAERELPAPSNQRGLGAERTMPEHERRAAPPERTPEARRTKRR
jgi:hypothetical protein